MIKQFILLTLLVFSTCSRAQEVPLKATGKNIVNYDRLRFLNVEKENGFVQSNAAKTPEEIVLTIETQKHPDFIYKLASKLPLYKTNLAAGQIVLVSFEAKTEFASLETGEARSLWLLNVSENPKEKITQTLSISSDWQRYYMPMQVIENVESKDFSLVVQFGFPPQQFLIKDFKCEVMPEGTKLESLPKTKITYQGMEEDAVWRKAADSRIEKYRKGDIKIKVTREGVAVPDFPMSINLEKHHFWWGAGVKAEEIINEPARLQAIARSFNMVVLQNDLKIKAWSKKHRREETLQAIDLIREKGLAIKGHVLIWPGYRYLTPKLRGMKDPEEVTKAMHNHVYNILKTTDGKIDRWDVVNEAYTNRDLQKITGSEAILYDGFFTAKNQSPQALRYVNEYGIISKGGLDKKKQEWYYEYIKRVDKETNGLLDGIGIQCHIGSDLTPPKKVIELLDYYGVLGKKIAISEFTMEIPDADVRKQYTKDFMRAIFSHPSVYEFVFWGHHSYKADVFDDDYKPGTLGEAFYELVHQEWKTSFRGETNATGLLEKKGFYGTYSFSFVQDGEMKKGQFELLPGQSNVIEIKL